VVFDKRGYCSGMNCSWMHCSLFCLFPQKSTYIPEIPLSLFDFMRRDSVISPIPQFVRVAEASNRRVHITNDLDDVVDDEEDEDEVWIGLVLGDGSDLQLGLGLPFQPHVDVVDHAVAAQVPALGELTARHPKRRRSISR
jgi:hypothetical protein